jgi:phosphoesterase RecJ-like protein
MELLAEGRIAFVSITCEMFKRYDASMEHAEEVINVIRDIEGVEYAFVLKEAGPDKIRVSMRAKTYGNVGSIAAALGGGGHMKAAGCTLKCGLDEAVTKVKAEIGMLAL